MGKHEPMPQPLLRASASKALSGTVTVPGDKSISHRSLIFAAQAVGHSTIRGLLEGDDVLRTKNALKHLGATIYKESDGVWHVHGVGVGGFTEPDDILDLGNSGTGVRLLMGLVSGYPFKSFFTGDESLRSRPMKRVMDPLTQMGAVFHSRTGGVLPLVLEGTDRLVPIRYTLPVASAQVKSAVLLAGINCPGETTVVEPVLTRDHTERMLQFFGADIRYSTDDKGAKVITLKGRPEFKARKVVVPGDPSSAAFLVVAALIIPDSDIVIERVGMNPQRTGLFETLKEMGADISWDNKREEAGEPIADLHVRYSRLKGVEVPASRAPSMIDEYPILSIAAAFAKGRTVMKGLHELRVKESDRLKAVSEGLLACRVMHHVEGDTLIVEGTGEAPMGGSQVKTHMDHRIAMAFLVCGLASQKAITVDGAHMIQTSFPQFVPLMQKLGAQIEAMDA